MTTTDGTRLITDRLAEIAARDPGRELIVCPVFGRFTYSRALQQAERLAFALRELGLGRGDIVILQLPNWAPFLVFHLALTLIGAVTATVPIVFRERELRNAFQLTEAKGIVVPSRHRGHDYLDMIEKVRESAPSLDHIFAVDAEGEARGENVHDYGSLMRKAWEAGTPGSDLTAMRPDAADMTALGFTSGTTGALKAAMWNTQVLAATNRGLADRYDLNESDRIFGCSPIGHAVGFTHALRMAVTIGGSIVLQDRWDPGAALERVRQEGCTFMACATPFLLDLVYHPALRVQGSLSSVRLFLCGGTSVPDKLMRDSRTALPHTFTSPLWGMTECGGVTTCPFDAPEEKLLTTDGLPCESMELKVVSSDGQAMPPGEDGELMVRGPMVTMGYYRQPELTGESYMPDGFFRTGDQARMDEDGYIKITGRIKDLIIRGGVNISPADIEEVLFAHPRVASAAVVGMPDPRLGERICAFVTLKEGKALEVEDVQSWMKEAGIAKQKWPERIEIVEELPMTPSGKVQRYRLRDMLAGETDNKVERA